MRLIDADALKVLFDKQYDYADMRTQTSEDREYWNHWNGFRCGVYWGLDTIADAPTINPEDCRPQGRWIKTCVPDIYQCEHCKKATKMDELCDSEILRAYCPNCGAKMDGKEQGSNEDNRRF